MAAFNTSLSSPAAASSSPTPRRRTEAPRRLRPSSQSPPRKMRSIDEIIAVTAPPPADKVKDDSSAGGDGVDDVYADVICEKCGSGKRGHELLLCDMCDKGFHMRCLRPIVVRVPIGKWFCVDCSETRPVRCLSQRKIRHFFRIEKEVDDGTVKPELSQEETTTKNKKRSRPLTMKKRSRKLLPFVPSKDSRQGDAQLRALAWALTSQNIKYSNELTYVPGMAPRSANRSMFEIGGVQVLSKEDFETLEQCRAMNKRGDYPPLVVVEDDHQGFTVQADGPIKDLTLIAEYTGEVDYLKNREKDDCDSMMTLLSSEDPSKSLVICPDRYGNISRFVSGINNHTRDGKKKQNCKCVRYSINGEVRVLLVATRDISKGEKLYYDYNGHENEYPTHLFL